MYDDLWRTPTDDELSLFGRPPSLLDGEGRVSHLVFLDGRLVDAWTESHHDTRWASLAR